jgi:ABC-2 type transport system permease protein
MTDLIAAEWIKIRSLRSTFWTLGLTTLLVVGAAAVAAKADYANFPSYNQVQQRTHGFSLSDAFPLVAFMTMMLVAAGIGAVAMVSEYSTGLIRTTTVAVPARGSVLLAKAIVVAALWTVAGAVTSTLSFVVSQAILAGRDADVSITDPGAFPALLGATLVGPVCALIGLGLGVLIRHSATTMVTGVVLLLMLPSFFTTHRQWSTDVNHAMVLSAWQRLTQTYGPPQPVGTLYASFAGSWIVYAVWPLAALAMALVVIRRRDV